MYSFLEWLRSKVTKGNGGGNGGGPPKKGGTMRLNMDGTDIDFSDPSAEKPPPPEQKTPSKPPSASE